MTNTIKGEVTFEAAGKVWTLCYSVNALCALESEVKGSAMAVAQTLSDPGSVRIETLRALFWAGLRDHHPEATIDEAGRLMTALGFQAAVAKSSEAFAAAFGEESARPLAGKPARPGKRS